MLRYVNIDKIGKLIIEFNFYRFFSCCGKDQPNIKFRGKIKL